MPASNPIAMHGGAPRQSSSSGREGPVAAGAGAAFAALDAEPATGAPSWVHAGARQAEAGFEDPALGWVGVRADLAADGVHAAIVPGSAEAAQALDGQMAGLGAHLAAEHIHVESLNMATANGGKNLGADHAPMQQGAGQQSAGQGTEHGGSFPASAAPRAEGQSVSRDASAANETPEDATGGRMWSGGAASGTHISVMA